MRRRTILVLCLSSLIGGCSTIQIAPTDLPLPVAPVRPHLVAVARDNPFGAACLVSGDWKRLVDYFLAVDLYSKQVEVVRTQFAPTPKASK